MPPPNLILHLSTNTIFEETIHLDTHSEKCHWYSFDENKKKITSRIQLSISSLKIYNYQNSITQLKTCNLVLTTELKT